MSIPVDQDLLGGLRLDRLGGLVLGSFESLPLMKVAPARTSATRCGALLGHGASGDIADHYTHIDDEMIEEMLARQAQRWQAAVAARARIDTGRGAGPRSAVPALDEWLAPFRERGGESSSHLRSHRHDPEVEA